MKLTPSEPDIRTIIERIDQADIDLQPDFQRQEVWSTTKKKRLIDTVLRGWSIPPIHFVETVDNKLEVLDGQQRLASLRDFVHNRFAVDGNVTPFDPAIRALHGKFYKQLDPSVKRRFDQYALRCFRITDYLPEEPNELFYRLNQPTMLTAGEQRNALFGPAREQLKAAVALFEQCGNDKATIGFSNARLAYDDVFARLFFFLDAQNFGIKGTESLISERFRSKLPFEPEVVSRVNGSISLFSEARNSSQPNRFNKASVLSWLLFFSRFSGQLPLAADFMQRVIDARQKRLARKFVVDAVLVFEDRSSLRVTDVSSVVYRDFALCYLYHFLADRPLPDRVPIGPILALEEVLSDRDDITFEGALASTLDIERWSTTL